MAEYDDRLRAADRNAPDYDPNRDQAVRTATYIERPRDTRDTRDARDLHDDRPRHQVTTAGHKNVLDWLALILLIVGGLNWGLVGLFGIDLVASVFGPGSMISRVIYIAVGVAALWGFALTRLGPTRHH
jgi:uncharacterized membrane protein YuzA (DUF378 family)